MPEDAPVLGKQALKSKNTREKIINAVISLIKEGGFHAATASRIAERAGLTWGAAQHHFRSKEEILDAVMALSHERFTELMNSPALRKGPLSDRTDRFIDKMWEHYQDDVYLAALEILLATRSAGGQPQDVFEMRTRAHLKTLREIFPDVKLGDEQILDALVFVHCFLTGLTIEKVFENGIRHADLHLKRIKVVLLSMLSFG